MGRKRRTDTWRLYTIQTIHSRSISGEKKSGSNGMGIMIGSQLKDKVAKLKYRFRSQSCHRRGKCEVKKVKKRHLKRN